MYLMFYKLKHFTYILLINYTISSRDVKEEYLNLIWTIEKLKSQETGLSYKAISGGILEKLQLLEVASADIVI